MKKIQMSILTVVMVFLTVTFAVYIKDKKFKTDKSTSDSRCDKCNVFMMDIDILRADELPCYGYTRDTAPNICAFAKNSVLFEDNYSASNWTLPDIFSTITSLYPTFHRVIVMYGNKLNPEFPTLAETLQKKGYQTYFVGGDLNDATLSTASGGLRGYDVVTNKPVLEILDSLKASSRPWFIHYYSDYLHSPYLVETGTKLIDNLEPPAGLPITYDQYNQILNTYVKKNYQKVFTKKAIAEYGSIIMAPSKPGDLTVSNLFYKLGERTVGRLEYLLDAWAPKNITYLSTFDNNDRKVAAFIRMMYDTKISVLDGKLGQIFKKLDDQEFVKNTVKIVMSNHGEAFGEHGQFNHDFNNHTELFYTPLIINSPNITSIRIKKTTSNIDIFPTILDLVNIKNPGGLQGISLYPYIFAKDDNLRPFVYSEGQLGTVLQNKQWLYFLPIKAVSPESSILYDKLSDPSEVINVASKYPDLVESLYKQARFLRSYRETDFNIIKSPSIEINMMSPEKVERLKKEGYF